MSWLQGHYTHLLYIEHLLRNILNEYIFQIKSNHYHTLSDVPFYTVTTRPPALYAKNPISTGAAPALIGRRAAHDPDLRAAH